MHASFNILSIMLLLSQFVFLWCCFVNIKFLCICTLCNILNACMYCHYTAYLIVICLMNLMTSFKKKHMWRHRSRAPVCLCHIPALPTMGGRLDWHVIQRSQKQELLGTYAFSVSTIAVSQFFGKILHPWTVN